MEYSVPILLYHRIDTDNSILSTSPEVFRTHMQYLSERGWRSLSLDEFTFYAWSGKKLPSRSFLITFDDGYESLFRAGAEILKEFNFKATCFLCTSFIREPASPIDLNGLNIDCFLSWDQVRSLEQSGFITFQSHTHTHQNFADLSLSELENDLDSAQSVLSSELNLTRHNFQHLAWPWGKSQEAWRQVAKRCGLRYQYTVERQTYLRESSQLNMPRTCYDGASLFNFQSQFWLQVGPLGKVWRNTYPLLRSLRHPVKPEVANSSSTISIDDRDLGNTGVNPSNVGVLENAHN